MRKLQSIIDAIGMYRTVSGGLGLLAFCAIVAGALGWIAYSPVVQLLALGSGVALALILNIVLARVRHLPANHESAIITVLILFFLVIPETHFFDNWPLWAAIAIAILSKFFITYRGQHIVNPAAFGALALSLSHIYEMSWWVANPVLFIPLMLVGVAVVMKVRKWGLVLSGVAAAFVVFMFESVWVYGESFWPTFIFGPLSIEWSWFTTFWLSWPTLFLAFFMLTEPFTMPPMKRQQLFYGGFVGALSNTSLFMPLLVMSPELALVIGNLVVYPWRIRRKLLLRLEGKREIGKSIFEYSFAKPKGFTFAAGQYLEWMLPHQPADSRGPRRYFTIASAPSDSKIMLACKHVGNGSSYKRALAALAPGKLLIASQLAGDFVLPRDTKTKLGFIAGGIGITPFVSHLREMQATKQPYDTVLYYCVKDHEELAYQHELVPLETTLPFKQISVVAEDPGGGNYESGFITPSMLHRRTPDFLERVWYISGPPPMVNAYKALLLKAGVSRRQIKTDFFPGLA